MKTEHRVIIALVVIIILIVVYYNSKSNTTVSTTATTSNTPDWLSTVQTAGLYTLGSTIATAII